MYNGLQVSWVRRFAAGSMFQFSYTFSKSMDNSSNYRDIVPNTYNTSNLWGPSEYDVRHMIVINYLWNIPIFESQSTLAGKVAWRLAAKRHDSIPDGLAMRSRNQQRFRRRQIDRSRQLRLRFAGPVLGAEWASTDRRQLRIRLGRERRFTEVF